MAPYLILVDGQEINGTSIAGLSAGMYSVTVIDANNCELTEEVILTEPPILDIDLPADTTIFLGDSLTIDLEVLSGSPDSIFWMVGDSLACIGCLQLTLRPLASTVVEVVALDANNCIDQEMMRITVRVQRRLYIPNVFSPNGDDINDSWGIFGGPEVTLVRNLQIFNRWGNLVHEIQNYNPQDPPLGWDGSSKGQECPSGVYVYRGEVEFIDGLVQTFMGDVTLLR